MRKPSDKFRIKLVQGENLFGPLSLLAPDSKSFKICVWLQGALGGLGALGAVGAAKSFKSPGYGTSFGTKFPGGQGRIMSVIFFPTPIFLILNFFHKFSMPLPLFPIWHSSQQPYFHREDYIYSHFTFFTLYSSPQPWYYLPLFTTWYSSSTVNRVDKLPPPLHDPSPSPPGGGGARNLIHLWFKDESSIGAETLCYEFGERAYTVQFAKRLVAI